jgi:hypothetical protein
MRVLFFMISPRRSRGEESRDEKRIAGPWFPGSSASGGEEEETAGCVDGDAVVGGLEVMTGLEDSRREA